MNKRSILQMFVIDKEVITAIYVPYTKEIQEFNQNLITNIITVT